MPQLTRSSTARSPLTGVEPGAAASTIAASASGTACSSAAPAAVPVPVYRELPAAKKQLLGQMTASTAAVSQSIMDATATSLTKANDTWLYRVLTATEAPDQLREVPEKYMQRPPKEFRRELINAVAPSLVLFLLVGRVY